VSVTKDEWNGGDATFPNSRDYMIGDLYIVRELKRMVLKREGRRVVAISVQGSEAITCSIVAHDPDIGGLYQHDIVWAQLGEISSAATVIKQVTRVVRATGGHLLAIDIKTEGDRDLDDVRETARESFFSMSILFVVDNVYPADDVRGGNWINILKKIPGERQLQLFLNKES
jgi:hypothetical protein